MPKLYINFEEILLCAHGNSDEQNKVLESSIIIINYCTIIINAYYNYMINAKYNYYNSNIDLRNECNKNENVEVNGDTATSCLKRRL